METLEVPSEYEGKFVYCKGDRALNQTAHNGCRFTFPEDTENPPGCNPVQPSVGWILSMSGCSTVLSCRNRSFVHKVCKLISLHCLALIRLQ